MGLGKTLTMISLVMKDKQMRPESEAFQQPQWLSKGKFWNQITRLNSESIWYYGLSFSKQKVENAVLSYKPRAM